MLLTLLLQACDKYKLQELLSDFKSHIVDMRPTVEKLDMWLSGQVDLGGNGII